MSQYVAELRKLAEGCEFNPAFLEEPLHDRLVCEIKNDAIKRRLLSEEALDLKKACDIAVEWNCLHCRQLNCRTR